MIPVRQHPALVPHSISEPSDSATDVALQLEPEGSAPSSDAAADGVETNRSTGPSGNANLGLNRPRPLSSFMTESQAKEALSDQAQLSRVAREVLRSLGVSEPSGAQIGRMSADIVDQLKNNSWQRYTPTLRREPIERRGDVSMWDTIMFGEDRVFLESELTSSALQMHRGHFEGLNDFESGRVGMLLAATFINKSSRANGNFAAAYGDLAWNGFVQAHTMLNDIPIGQFIGRLNKDLMCEVNRLIHAPDEGTVAVLKRAVHSLLMGREDKGGRIREGAGFASLYSFNETQYQAVLESGVAIKEVPGSVAGKRKGFLQYPAPDTIDTRLKEIVEELKHALAQPNADVIDAAAQFQRSFVALHPFEDSNGRTSRLLMNRILAEFNLPPAVFRDQNGDISCTRQEWRREVAEGIARSSAFLLAGNRYSYADFLADHGVRVMSVLSRMPVVVAGQPFDLGQDGLLYGITGRPHLSIDGELVPLSQMEAYVFSRRLASMPASVANVMLAEATMENLSLLGSSQNVKRIDEKAAYKADVEFKMDPHPKVAALLCELAKVSHLDPTTLFTVHGATGTVASQVMSKYTQHDLELWHLEQAVAGNKALKAQVRGEREKLFAMAETALLKETNFDNASETNPLGFTFEYERIMYRASPLRFSSLAEAIAKDGDDALTLWRGDYGHARWFGMAPNNDVREKSARETAKERAGRGVVGHMIEELNRLEGDAGQAQYICATSDLALLADKFAEESNSKHVDMDRVAGWLRPVVLTAVKVVTRKQPSSPTQRRSLSNFMRVPGRIADIDFDGQGNFTVTAHRKAFELRVDKRDLLPGLQALGQQKFSGEQEIHGLERIGRGDITAVMEHTDLWRTIDQAGNVDPAPAQQPDLKTTKKRGA